MAVDEVHIASMAHIRQSRPDFDLGFQDKTLKPFKVYPLCPEVANVRATTSQECGAVPERARIQGAKAVVSLNFRLESDKEEEQTTHKFTPRMAGEVQPLDGGRRGAHRKGLPLSDLQHKCSTITSMVQLCSNFRCPEADNQYVCGY